MRRATSLEIELPDGTILDAPDDADASAVARAYMAKQPGAPAVSTPPVPQSLGDFRDQYAGQGAVQGNLNYAKDYGRGIASAVTKPRAPDTMPPLVGLGETALHLGSSALAPLFALPDYAITKMGLQDKRNPAGTYAGAREKYVYQPRTSTGQAGADIAGAALKPVGDVFSLIGSGYGDVAGLAGASPAVQQGVREIVPDIVSAGLTAGALRAPKPAKAAIPTKEELGTQAKAAYKRAEDAGIAVSPQSFDAMKLKLLDKLEREGIDKDLHPKATAALNRVASTDGPVTLEKIETLRRIAKDAESSIDKADRRMAGELIDHLDEYVGSLAAPDLVSGNASKAAALKEARGFYSRKSKADEIDRLISNAELSDSGMERGLRSEFKSLAKNQRRLRMFTKEEQAAIRKAAKGGPTQFLLRQFGKFSSGPFGLTVGSGLGFAAGGPVGAAVIPPAAALARFGAGRMTMRNAQAAQELMRRGPQQATPMAPPQQAMPPAPAAGILGSSANSEAAQRQQLMQMLGLLNQ